MQNFSLETLAVISGALLLAQNQLEKDVLKTGSSVKTEMLLNVGEAYQAVEEYMDELRPKTRPATDYEKAMSGKDTMPANSIPWHD